jgi:hypothetical protein
MMGSISAPPLERAEAAQTAGTVPAAVTSLVSGSLSTMLVNKRQAAGMVVLVLGTGATVLAYQASQMPVPFGHPPRFNYAASSPPGVVASEPSTPANDVADWVPGWPDLTRPPENDVKNKPILEALEKPIPMQFSKETPLRDVLAYVRKATEGPGLPKGIIIYVDPEGLRDSDKTMDSTVSIDLEELPLKTTLDLLLRQLYLYYRIQDGLMIISSRISYDYVTPLSIMEEKADRGELNRLQYKQLIEALTLRNEVRRLKEMDGGRGAIDPAVAPMTPR